MRSSNFTPGRILALGLAILALAGCATVSPDAGIDAVQTLARERIGNDATLPRLDSSPTCAAAATRDLLAMPFSPDAAVDPTTDRKQFP